MKKILEKLIYSLVIIAIPFASFSQVDCESQHFDRILEKLEMQEWKSLFNGNNFEGWDQREGKAPFTIENGIITGTAKAGEPSSFLCTKKVYHDFILEVDFKVDRWMNSGIQIRSHSRPDYKNGEVYGYQIEIDPSERSWSGGVFDQSRRGWIGDLKENEPARKAFKANDWNHFRIVVIGPHIKTWINGVPAADIVDYEDFSGFIALQLHLTHNNGPRAVHPGAQAHWKNIKIKSFE